MNKKLILFVSTLMIGFFTVAGVASVITTTNTNNIERVGDDCDKCGKKECKGECEKSGEKKECSMEAKKSCSQKKSKSCNKGKAKSCPSKKASTEEKKS